MGVDTATVPTDQSASFQAWLSSHVTGDVRFDALSRTLYSTDASIYEMIPSGVVMPRSVEDVVRVVEGCRAFDTSIVPRGGATGLAGGAVGSGLQLDMSRYMGWIGAVDVSSRTVDVGPGVVLDDLNRALASSGLQFGPDVATSSRATLGGMIANNSCGAYSIKYGRTVDHVASLTMVLSTGEVTTLRDGVGVGEGDESDEAAGRIQAGLRSIGDAYRDEILSRYPKVLRSNGGYGLDRWLASGGATRVVCGSEGTLGVIVGARLRLVPRPRHRVLVIFQFGDLHAALSATPRILEHGPAAVELVDRMILSAGRQQPQVSAGCGFLRGTPEAILAVEFHGDSQAAVDELAASCGADRALSGVSGEPVVLRDDADREAFWRLRRAGLGLLMSRPGHAQPHAFVEDSAVDPARLADYIARFRSILDDHRVVAGYYAHASAGCIHVRPVLDLTDGADVERMRSIADRVSDLAVEFGGTMTGEHGDGLIRSCWLEKIYGPRLMQAFGEVKALFDPHGMMNPGKIVDAPDMTAHLRQGAGWRSVEPRTMLDFSPHASMAGLAGMCSGVGQCRQTHVGAMCPSYMATLDERHTTRGRANALRIALSDRGLLKGLNDAALGEVMDLCLSCKACKTECPTGVDMAKLKAEYLHQRHLDSGASLRSRFLADLPSYLAMASRFPRMSRWVSGLRPVRRWVARRYGFEPRVAMPTLALRTFRQQYRSYRRSLRGRQVGRGRDVGRGRQVGRDSLGTVAYLSDCWTNYFTPEVGLSAVRLLEAAGFKVISPSLSCCGRTAISAGLLGDAIGLARQNVRALEPLMYVDAIVGTEPSCLLTLADEYPSLLHREGMSSLSRRIAERVRPVESFLLETLGEEVLGALGDGRESVLLHVHCHQKASSFAGDSLRLLKALCGEGGSVSELATGCCGMAGSFGQEVEHYEVGRAVGEERLFPAVRASGGVAMAVTGFSCRQQLMHHVGVSVRHPVELAASWLVEG
ncbi:MAG: FAD-binding and (Fe-S)-binding domain-containing protein [Phycisphaerae bacterium]